MDLFWNLNILKARLFFYLDWHFQTMSIERVRRSNQSNAIECDRTVEIWLSNAIESQSNITPIFLDSIEIRLCSIGSIEIWLRSVEMLRQWTGWQDVFLGSECGLKVAILSSFCNCVEVVLHGYLPARWISRRCQSNCSIIELIELYRTSSNDSCSITEPNRTVIKPKNFGKVRWLFDWCSITIRL